MSAISACRYCLFWILALPLYTCQGVPVICFYSKDCILPCSYNPGTDVVIHWQIGAKVVHSFYNGNDQLKQQEEQYKYRTSLFKDELQKGNASLLLRNLQIDDEQSYHCYVGTFEGSYDTYIELKVASPVTYVQIETNETENTEEIECRSSDIYPAPSVTWSYPTNESYKEFTNSSTDVNKLYSVVSKLTKEGMKKNTNVHNYSCKIKTWQSQWETTLTRQEQQIEEGQEWNVSCMLPNVGPQNCKLAWKTSNTNTVTATFEKCKQPSNTSEIPNNILLKDDHFHVPKVTETDNGTYTCSCTYGEVTKVCQIKLIVIPGEANNSTPLITVVIAVAVVVVVVLLAVVLYCRKKNKKNQSEHKNGAESYESTPLKSNSDDQKTNGQKSK
uniref:Ig-like domain-containing protein n=1 Tax=Erpetoichthys calabaricus TaxID=27687 RepID=A0A8C4T3H1_ERPCA